MKVGYIKLFPNVLLIEQGRNERQIWFHGLNDVYLLSDFIEMSVHPCLYNNGSTITEKEIVSLFKPKL